MARDRVALALGRILDLFIHVVENSMVFMSVSILPML